LVPLDLGPWARGRMRLSRGAAPGRGQQNDRREPLCARQSPPSTWPCSRGLAQTSGHRCVVSRRDRPHRGHPAGQGPSTAAPGVRERCQQYLDPRPEPPPWNRVFQAAARPDACSGQLVCAAALARAAAWQTPTDSGPLAAPPQRESSFAASGQGPNLCFHSASPKSRWSARHLDRVDASGHSEVSLRGILICTRYGPTSPMRTRTSG
jgi:hypothetical protein